MSVQRYGQIIKLKPDKYNEYKELHAHVWPEVLATIKAANICNYSIYHWNGYLFSYFEYTGKDFQADMAKIAADPTTHEWWKLTDPCQIPVEGNSPGSAAGNWWTPMEE